jgi:hypothetical protein
MAVESIRWDADGQSLFWAKRFGGAYAQELQRRATRKEEITMMQKVASIALALGLIGACAFAQDAGQPTGAVQGLVFITEPDGGRSVVPATKITLDGPAHIEAQSDNEGKFAFSTVATGSFTTPRTLLEWAQHNA